METYGPYWTALEVSAPELPTQLILIVLCYGRRQNAFAVMKISVLPVIVDEQSF